MVPYSSAVLSCCRLTSRRRLLVSYLRCPVVLARVAVGIGADSHPVRCWCSDRGCLLQCFDVPKRAAAPSVKRDAAARRRAKWGT
jgi:hypothetical protein